MGLTALEGKCKPGTQAVYIQYRAKSSTKKVWIPRLLAPMARCCFVMLPSTILKDQHIAGCAKILANNIKPVYREAHAHAHTHTHTRTHIYKSLLR